MVRHELEENERFFAKHGEGPFGYSHASYEELRNALADLGLPEEEDSEWVHALASVEFAMKFGRGAHPDWRCRFIVWAVW